MVLVSWPSPAKSKSPQRRMRTPKTSPKEKSGKPVIRFADLQEIKKTNTKLMQVHRKVLQKLAQ
jgi:hypothetical protein